MTVAAESSVTVETVLFPARNTEDTLTSTLRALGIVAEMVRLVAGIDAATVDGDVAGGIAGLLDMPISDVLFEAWSSAGELEAAARSTAAEPGRTEHVTLATQQVGLTWKPSVDLIVNGRRCGTIHLEVQLALEITLLRARVRSGRLVDLDWGACDLTASLSAGGHELATRTVHLDPHATVRLGDGIPLVRRQDADGRSTAPASGPSWVLAGGRPTVVAPASA
jgi:hypothetical protein